jgi:hypothetical protein
VKGQELRSFGRAAASLALFAAAALISIHPAHAGCTRDSECKGTRICEEGRCVNPRSTKDVAADVSAQPATVAMPPPAMPSPAVPAVPQQPPPLPQPEAGQWGGQPGIVLSPSPRSTPSGDTVAVEMSGPEGYVIRVTNLAGTTVECVSPCVLQLNPGQARVHVVGYFDQVMQVPTHPTSARFSLRRTGWIATGAVVGIAGLIHAIVLYSIGAQSRDWAPAPAVLSAAGFGIMIGELAGSRTAIEFEGAPFVAAAPPSLAFGLLPQRNGGVIVTGMQF